MAKPAEVLQDQLKQLVSEKEEYVLKKSALARRAQTVLDELKRDELSYQRYIECVNREIEVYQEAINQLEPVQVEKA